MKIKISTSSKEEAIRVAGRFFNERAIDVAFRQNSASRETVVLMSPDQFLKLAAPGHSETKEEGVRLLIGQGIKFSDIPFLGAETNKDGDLEVVGNGNDHEGRHRVRALKELGEKQIPVRITSKEHGDGPCFRWGQTDKRPKKLIGYNGYSIPFPQIETGY